MTLRFFTVQRRKGVIPSVGAERRRNGFCATAPSRNLATPRTLTREKNSDPA